MPGIGLKTAAALIKEFGSLDALLERAGEIKQPKRRETLLANIDQARLSRKLVALMEDVPVPVALDDLTVPEPDPEKLVGFLKAMEFNTLTRRIAQMLHVDPEKVKPDPALLPGAKSAGASPCPSSATACPRPRDSRRRLGAPAGRRAPRGRRGRSLRRSQPAGCGAQAPRPRRADAGRPRGGAGGRIGEAVRHRRL